MTALLAACSAVTNFQTVSRVVVNDPEFAPTVTVATPIAQPALILVEDVERHTHSGHGTPTKRTLGVMLMIWAQKPRDIQNPAAPDQTTTGATLVNTLLEALESVFVADDPSTGCFTLGRLVQRAWIEGTLTKVSGDLDPNGQTFLAVPISILIP
jgi:hypothetical protein